MSKPKTNINTTKYIKIENLLHISSTKDWDLTANITTNVLKIVSSDRKTL